MAFRHVFGRSGHVVVAAALIAGLVACGEAPDTADPEEAVSSAPAPVQAGTPVDSAAAAILDRARAAHGAAVLDRAEVSFAFRGVPFSVRRDGGQFAYRRTLRDRAGLVRDELTNDGFRRTVDGRPVSLSETDALAAEGALNSVVYFALLPYPLADPAVRPRLLGADTLRGEPYDLVEVTFRPEGGGRDYQDRFLYWIHADEATMDYLAYSYEVGEGGARFREAINPRTVGGVRFADYRNYSAEPREPALETFARLFEADSLTLVSTIRTDSITVRALPDR